MEPKKKVYPITVTDAVYDSDGNKLSNVLLGVLKDTDISNVQSDSTTTVPSSALLKATDDKIGDTSSLPGDAGNVVSAINQLNSRQSKNYQNSVLSDNVVCNRVGNIVMISFSGNVTSLPPNETFLFNLDADYFPSSNVISMCSPLATAGVQLTITALGRVTFYNYNSDALTNSLRFCVTYIAKS